jgi:hypothetical protein
MMYVSILNRESDTELIFFLDELSKVENSVLGYHYPFYRDMLENINIGIPFYLGLYENDKITAVLPGFFKESSAGKVYSSLPFFGPNSGILCLSKKKENYAPELLNYLSDYLYRKDFISASLYSSFMSDIKIEEGLMAKLFPLQIEKFTSYIDMENLSIPAKVSYDIRKAKKEGVIISTEITDQRIIELYSIYKQNCLDFDIPEKPKKCIEMLCNYAKSIDNTTVYFAEYEGKVIGGLIMIWSKSVASYYLPCSLNEYRTLQSNTLLINQAFEEAQRRNIKIWNWESSPSTDSGVYKFKKKWGSVDGNYKIFLKTLKEEIFYKNLGKEKISNLFPHYYVYPFNQLGTI